jgi:NAD+ kinase
MNNKIIIYGNNTNDIGKTLKQNGFVIVDKSPDFVVSFGGDGTLMQAEEKYPGIPKIILKNSRICKLCSPLTNNEVLEKIQKGKYKIENSLKLICYAKRKELIAMNDITLHNSDPRHAIRYKFAINGKWIEHEIIGDGIVVATPIGSTGYYRSITDSFFELGIGLAFNNSTEQSDHMVLKENSKIELEITRGPAVVFADNIDDKITLDVGDSIVIEKYKEVTKLVQINED